MKLSVWCVEVRILRCDPFFLHFLSVNTPSEKEILKHLRKLYRSTQIRIWKEESKK